MEEEEDMNIEVDDRKVSVDVAEVVLQLVEMGRRRSVLMVERNTYFLTTVLYEDT